MDSKERHDLLFGVRRSIRYHSRRRMFFDRWGMITDAISIIFGSASIAAILKGPEWQPLALAAGFMVTFFSTANMVAGTAKAARLHHDLARRFIELEKRIMALPDPSPEDLIALTNTRLDIETEEPPVLRVLDIICHNELMRAMGYQEGFFTIGWFQRLLAPFIDFRDDTITAP